MTQPRFRRARTLAVFLDGQHFNLYNYISHSVLSCDVKTLALLSSLDTWTRPEALMHSLAEYEPRSVAADVRRLVEFGAVIVEGTEAAHLDLEFERTWLWGHVAGVFHFGTSYGQFLSVEEGDRILRERVKHTPPPRLYLDHGSARRVNLLPTPAIETELYSTMARRRTNRRLVDSPVSLDDISSCLFFSLRITAMLENPDIVDLPIKMTPSGGALNPYEAYLCARNVGGLDRGVYHYSAIEHSLALVDAYVPPFSSLLAGQEWTDNAAATLLLVAHLDRPMWKYRDPGAYRVVLIEAGHIAQNVMLVATRLGFSANPTCAFDQASLEATLHVSSVTSAVIYAVVLGVPETPFEWDDTEEYEHA